MKQYEIFQDPSYYDMYCVRAIDDRDFEHTLHFLKKEEALHAKEVLEIWTKSIYCEMHSREKGLINVMSKWLREVWK